MTIKTMTHANGGRRAVWLLGLLFAACNGNHVLGIVNGPDATGAAGTTGLKSSSAGGATYSGTGDATIRTGAAIGNGLPGEKDGGWATSCSNTGAGGYLGGAGGYLGSQVNSAPVTSTGPLGPAQTWTGYVERTSFPSGSESIKLSFAADATGNVAGTVVFGQGTPPPPATDPNVGYPSGWNGQDLVEGYVYQMRASKLTSQHLTFVVALPQLWSGWCALQTPQACVTTCIPPGEAETTDSGCIYRVSGTKEALDCNKARLCNKFCYCQGGTCRAVLDLGPDQPYDTAVFDLFLTGDTANGSATGDSFAVYPGSGAHFVKDAPPDGGT